MAAVSEIYFCKLRTVGPCTQVYVCVCVYSIPLNPLAVLYTEQIPSLSELDPQILVLFCFVFKTS